MNIFNKVRNIVLNDLKINESEVNSESKFRDDLGMDSLDLVELIMEFEEEFNIEITDNYQEIITVKDAVIVIEEHIKKKR